MELNNYRCRAIAVLVTLHEIHMKEFLKTWNLANQQDVKLPDTSDPDYESLSSLLYHVFNSSRNYMAWMTKHLKLEDPLIKEVPPTEEIAKLSSEYSEHLLDRWKYPLASSQEVILDKVFKSNWGIDYSVEAMLEHSVMHLIRHEYQLKKLLEKSKTL